MAKAMARRARDTGDPPGFFEIARELRDMICDRLYESHEFEEPSDASRYFEVTARDDGYPYHKFEVTTPIASLRLVNRQFRKEYDERSKDYFRLVHTHHGYDEEMYHPPCWAKFPKRFLRSKYLEVNPIITCLFDIEEYFNCWISGLMDLFGELQTLTVNVAIRPDNQTRFSTPVHLYRRLLNTCRHYDLTKHSPLTEHKIYYDGIVKESIPSPDRPDEGLLARWKATTGLEVLVTVQELEGRLSTEEEAAGDNTDVDLATVETHSESEDGGIRCIFPVQPSMMLQNAVEPEEVGF